MHLTRISLIASIALAEGGCGLGVSQLPEVWDRTDSAATARMEKEVKKAIFCELRDGILRVKEKQETEGQVRYLIETTKVLAKGMAELQEKVLAKKGNFSDIGFPDHFDSDG